MSHTQIHNAALLSDLVDIVFLAERVEDDVDLIEHVHHLHGCDVDADLVKLDHVAEQDGHIWKHLRDRQTHRQDSIVRNEQYRLYYSVYLQ